MPDRSRRRGALALLLALAAGCDAATEANPAQRLTTDAAIYTDALVSPWQNWSWSTAYSLTNTAPVHAGTKSISFVPQNWEGLGFHYGTFSTTGYSAVSFWIHGGTTGGQKIEVFATVGGVDQPSVPAESYLQGGLTAIPAGAWAQVRVPLSALGVGASLSDVNIADASGAVQSRVYVDDVAILATTTCTPTTCAAQGKNCGSISDGCGGTLACGTCPSGQSCGGGGTANVCGTSTTTTGAPAIRVSGNRLVDQNGSTLQLRGVNRSGAEYACAEGWGIWDGPTDDDTSVAAMKAWKVNAVRLPLNEDCWLGINGVKAAYSGANYQSAIKSYVTRLNASGMIVILNLHFSAPGTQLALDQVPMPDRDHSNAFWTSVATYFKSNPSVMFDLFNEPYPDSNRNTTAAWQCVQSGGTCPGVTFTAAGMQEMTTAIRNTGATQPILVGGPQYAGVVDKWTQYKPSDPLNQLVASIHIYGLPLDSPCRLQSCWDATVAPLATTTPVVIGELGDTDCTSQFSPPLMTWADAHGVSYTAWAWNASQCGGGPSLITDYSGTPTAYGLGVKQHLQAFTTPF